MQEHLEHEHHMTNRQMAAPSNAVPHSAIEPSATVVLMTPEKARRLLKKNHSNRTLRPYHVNRIKKMIFGGRWRFNGDSVKVDWDGNLQDGQHRLQAIAESGQSCLLVFVTGVDKDAFATIDTVRLSRGAGDVVQLCSGGAKKYAGIIGSAVTWLCRYDKGIIPNWRMPDNKVENDEIEDKYKAERNIDDAIERCMVLKRLSCSVAAFSFIYYVLTRAGHKALADRMVDTMDDPSRARGDDPFFQLRKWMTGGNDDAKADPLHEIAIIIKAVNFAYKNEKVQVLTWRPAGKRPEQFPALEMDRAPK
jgi:hypothetical protein